MTLDLNALEAVARAVCVPEAWAIWHDLDHQGFKTVGDAESYAEMKKTGEADECDPIAHVYTDDLAEHIAAFDPPTVLALITKLREADAVIEKVREIVEPPKPFELGKSMMRSFDRMIGDLRRALATYKHTNQEGGNDGT